MSSFKEKTKINSHFYLLNNNIQYTTIVEFLKIFCCCKKKEKKKILYG